MSPNTHLFRPCALILAITGLIACGGSGQSDQHNPDVDLKNASQLERYLKTGYISRYSAQNQAYPVDSSAGETATDTSTDSDSGSDDYSSTNLQEQGVDEADLVKQNGEYLYTSRIPTGYGQTADNNTPAILSWQTTGNPVSSALVSSVELSDSFDISGLYLNGQTLIALTNSSQDAPANHYGQDDATLVDYYNPWYWQSYSTDIRLFDLSDPGHPQASSRLSIEGSLLSSRVVGQQLYAVIMYTPAYTTPVDSTQSYDDWYQELINTPLAELLPRVWVNGAEAGHLFEDGSCHISSTEDGGYPGLVALVRINLNNPQDYEARCNSGRINGVYASTDAIVLSGYDGNRYDATRLDWYRLSDLQLLASGSVPGTLDGSMPSFRLSERNGQLRVITSSANWGFWDTIAIDDVATVASDVVLDNEPTEPAFANAGSASSDGSSGSGASSGSDVSTTTDSEPDANEWDHRLFILEPDNNGHLQLLSSLPNTQRPQSIGKPGESIQAVRFMNERAYVVTFRNTDPLYLLNLANSNDPLVEGELEINGFSAYLHPLSDDLLLGIGRDADSNGSLLGLRIGLFDVSTPSAPQEISHISLGGQGSSSDVLWDHHAISFMEQDNGVRMAFTWSDYNDWNWQGDKLYVADINTSDQTITAQLNATFRNNSDTESWYWYYSGYNRVLLHNDGLHLITNGDTQSGPLSDWSGQ
ncbi:beta-propeller domain-containing protein [Parathalassolituus penaei]|uniref:Beta-propeller domain-containing protein n=1 Tax=Parathalassolituus penaei TaxID=2997323 RepID=A0A9X3EKB4_9GAMM|nr:beta-propeller domain-containing protein [Parathalassolituus penaei]MCY0965881.1 beta-propeller domain-containing protein [Parathalassolituus penaei]